MINLTKAGFTDITIMPQSLLVRAKDAQGNSVMMVINPDTLTEVTQQGTPGAAAKPKEAPLAGAIQGAPNSGVPSASAQTIRTDGPL